MSQLIGTIQTMHVIRKIETGYVLGQEGNEVEALLHHNEAEKQLEEAETVDIFLYNDKKGNLTATMHMPSISKEAYGWAEVVEVVPRLGAFVHIGISKDILISRDELPKFMSIWPQTGDKLLITLDLDYQNRLIGKLATGNIVADIFETAPENLLNQAIEGRVYYSSKEGTEILTTDGYRAFIHHTERKEEPRLGELVKGRVIAVKEDGTLNMSLIPIKKISIPQDAEVILDHLSANDGVIPFGDHSAPEDIRATFQMSKAAFKRALGRLLKEDKVEQRDGKIYMK